MTTHDGHHGADWRGLAEGLRPLARALAGNEPDADDLLQQAIANLLSRRPDRAAEPEYARRALVNAWMDRQRAVGRRLARLTAKARAAPAWHEPADPADEAELRRCVRRAVEALPPRQRAVLVMRTVEGLDDASIAQALGCSPGAVRSSLHLARRAVRARLGDEP